MPRSTLRPVAVPSLAVAALAASLGACASSRFDAAPPRLAARQARPAAPEAEPDLGPPGLAAGPVTSAPLAPPPGASAAPGEPAAPSGVAANPGGPIMAEPGPAPAPVQQQAALAPPPPVAAGGRSSVVGGWTAKDATGASCRITLASTPALDLYKATSSGCANKDLAKVTAWDYRDGEVYLYQPGGTVAARLRAAGGAMDGALSKSGAPLALVR
ncbi:outer membrane lipoprotein omp19 [Methylobacterium sp. 4-46]|uniref:AprI/Inh family metalloprotease inhibitor n=1 Tax=unclassified Methylobacterium TaxID=2615210 RepID=UPI000152D2EC|nr:MULTISPECIES: AprI/Inh family metalloprotease inhibitor [Methylobacterium]ACA20320.1 outer membrane lipoprotein omp19 [Methylobacterium sp. 4-46]WFT79494.1 AprI/Inh family metalloprotease inhibitor [Methylobacterium nodulans]